MLILRRKAGETLVIGDNIKVAVLDINEGSVRLAIEAPKEITILRSELLQAADANRDAAQGVPHPGELLHLMSRRGEGTLPGKPKAPFRRRAAVRPRAAPAPNSAADTPRAPAPNSAADTPRAPAPNSAADASL